MNEKIHATTVLCVRKDGFLHMIADGQMTQGSMILKESTKKIKTLFDKSILVGFAGSVSDALTLINLLETKIEKYKNLERACHELMKEWRTDKYFKDFNAQLIIADKKSIFLLSGDGNIIEPDEDVASIGSGSPYAFAAAKALYENTKMSAKEISEKAMKIAGNLCIYTNHNTTSFFIDFNKKQEIENNEVKKKKIKK